MKSAVLIIDVQCKFFDEEPRPYEADKVIQRINNITDRARGSQIPVIFIQAEQAGFLEHGSDSWKLQSDLIVHATDLIVQKNTPSCFLKTNLIETLASMGANNLIICGYASEFCIDSTARAATQLGYHVQLVADAHTTHEKQHLSAKNIREHHNVTLSMAPTITAVRASDITFYKKKQQVHTDQCIAE